MRVLPTDIPHRDRLIEKATGHLNHIAEVNPFMNLTRIASADHAAIKHVLDSVLPWRLFEGAAKVLDAGTGAGFPGIPLSLVLPDVEFILTDSIQKKARFVTSVSEALDLSNVEVSAERAEIVALARRPDIITAKAVAPLHRLVDLFWKALCQGSRLLVYKGPNVEAEIAEIPSRQVNASVVFRYELPDGLGSRSMISVTGKPRKRAAASQR